MKNLYLTLIALLFASGLFAQSITVTQPNGGELLYGCQNYTIKWTSSGVSNYYDIHYSLDGGTIWSSVATNINITNNQYVWTVPMATSSTVLIRVMDHNAPAKRDSSNGYFTINLPINVTAPNGGEVWQGLTSHLITWNPAGTSGIFNLSYSIDGGGTWTSIATNIAANNYTWSVPNNPSTQALVRVQDASTSCQLDVSNANFEISPATPILTAPNGGEQWTITSNRTITWNTATFYTNVKLEYSTDNGLTYNLITASTANSGSYTWNIPNAPSTQALVKASNATGSTISDASNAVFTIKNPANFLTSPNGGETWRSGNTYSITWDATAIASSVKLEYSTNNCATWNTIVSSTSNSGAYNWNIPYIVGTTQARVRITNLTVPTIMDTSNAVFTIVSPVTVDNPNTSANLTGCSTININWSRTTAFGNYSGRDDYAQYLNRYELYYSVNGGTENYITSVSNYNAQTTYSYNWTVPDLTPGSIKIKLYSYYSSQAGGGLFWIDSSDFAAPVVDPSGTITVTNPNGGVILNALTNYNITWTASGSSGYFDVLYSVNGGTSYSTLTSNISGNSYTWNVNNNPSTNVYIKVRDNQNNCRKDVSNASNTIIAATPILTSPNGGETWYVNSSKNITWTSANQYTNVMLEYSVDNGSSWNTIIASTTNSGSYAWTVPNTLTSQALVRISNVGDPSNFDVSNAVFNIAYPANFVTYPNGGEVLRSMNAYNITWNSTYFSSNVKLEYSLNNGSSWNTITNSASNSGSYSWTLPQTVTTTQALVRVTNVTVPAITDVSDAVFTIVSPVTVDNPNTSANLTGCSTISINWSRTTGFGNYSGRDDYAQYLNRYELYYSVNGGTENYITSVSNYNAQTSYSYNWSVPDVTPGSIKIKIYSYYSSQQGGSLFWVDSSDFAAPVVDPSGTITVTNPNGGVILNALTNYNITWTASGSSGYFDVLYSVNGGTSYSTLTSNISGNSYTWNVNNNPSTNVYIKVRDNQNNCRKDVSNASNTIIAATPILTSPNGGEIWKVNSTQAITWNTATLYGPALIEYSFDNGVSWNTVIASTPNTGSYSWTVPNTVTTHALIRISNVANPANYDVSNANFTINLPTPLLTSPNGGEVWRSMNTQTITWDASTVASNVKIEYSLNNGSTWNTVTASASNSGSYNWTVPQIVTTTQALVRITNISFPTAIDTSNAVFTIISPVTVDNPNTSTNLTGCSTISINWSRTTAFGNYSGRDDYAQYLNRYELYYSVNGGTENYITSVSNYNAQTSYSYSWAVPDVTPGAIKIKIYSYYSSQQGGSLFWVDSSDVAAPVVNPSGTITVTNPNGGVILNALTNYNITWTASGSSGYFDVLYSVNGGTSYSTLTSNISGNSYTWNVNNNPSTNVYIKVRDNQNNCRKDISNASNTIIAATPILTSPNGGETWKVNSTQSITWNTATLYGPAFIEYSFDNGVSWNTVVASTANTGSYSWIVPNTVTTQALIRISNVANPANYDVSNANFTINLPTPILTSPNGGEVWRSMNTHTITWDASTVASNVKIEYSLNNGSTWSTVTSSTTNTGSYNWTVPQIVTTTQALVRITNISFPTAIDTSNAVFTIISPVTVDNPNTSTNLTGCSTISINWSRTTAFGNYSGRDDYAQYLNRYELYYSVNGGTENYITSVSNYNAQTSYSYSWAVPDVTPGSIKIKIYSYYSSQQGGSLFWVDSSDVAAPVVSPSGTITVTNPNGGVILNALTNYNITWTASGSSGYFDVLYSVNGGTSYSTLTSNISGNSYTWNVNNNPSTNVYIKVRDNQNNCRKDVSNASNTIIAATPILTSPNGGETWYVNSSKNITWTSANQYTNVMLEYSVDNGSSWNTIIASTTNSGSYAWTVPNTLTSQALVRISNVGDPSNFDVSNAVFNIAYPANFVTYPNGGEVLRSMNAYNITWNSTYFSSNVKLEYSLNNGSSWNTITNSASNSGSYSWTLPQTVTTTQALVRVTNVTVPAITDVSDAVFTIVSPVTVDNPNTSANLTGCSTISINWSRTTGFGNYSGRDDYAQYLNRYELYYSVNGGTENYITSVSNYNAQTSYSYSWAVPDVAPGSIKIKIYSYYSSQQGGSLFWVDSSDFAAPVVNPSGSITITNPNGGVMLNALTNYNITWTSTGTSGYYDVLYSVNGGTSYTTLTTNTSSLSYTWNVNNNPSTNVYVKVQDKTNTCRKDISDAANTILAANPILTSPNGGEVWNVNSSHSITWNTSSLYGPVCIEYSTDNGTTWNYVVSSTSNTGTYNWTLPYTPTAYARIRISNVGNPSLYDISDNVFTILIPTPVVTAPNGGETWYAGTNQNITWLPATYFSSTVNIDYSLDNGSTWVNIVTNVTNSGTYTWTLPNVNSASALLRVSNYSNPSVYDVSDALLTLRPFVRLITPNGGDQLGSCIQTTITFERSPSYSAYNIEYSVDNGSNWVVLQNNVTYSQTFNNYLWTLPNSPSSQTLVRVYPFGNLSRGDQSDAVFTIKRPVTIIQPNYGGVLTIGSVYPIKWQSDGISNIYDLAYSTAGPSGPWTNIVIGYNTSLNTYNWTVPNTPSTNAYLRIRDNVNSCKEDISDMAFTISSSSNPITVTAPNGSDTLRACTAYSITWTESGAPIGNYNISYSIDYGTNWIPIVSNYLTTSGNYNWIVPNISVAGALIRVQSGLNPLVYDYSNALFVIKPGKLTTSSDQTICSGNSVQMSTTGGSSYSWNPTTGLSNPNIPDPIATPANTTLYIVSSTNAGCSLSDTVLVTVIPSSGLSASVSIAPNTSTAICNGTGVLFTASPVNGGTTPVYQWKKNGVNVGTNTYTYYTTGLANGDVITCIMTSSTPCMGNNPATSNAITMTVLPNVTPTASISTGSTSVCAGTAVTFNANTTNEGANPTYVWKKNGSTVGSNASIYIDNSLVNSDVISLQMTSNASCVSPATVTSNSLVMTVNPNVTPTISINTASTTVCSGNSVTFTATATNAGASPAYQWKVNGTNVGTNSNTYTTSTLLNNSSVTCTLTSSSACNTVNPVTSNAIVMTVNTAPAAPVASSNTPVSLNGTLNLYASTISGATYAWTGPNGFSSTNQNPVLPNATMSMAGTYSVVASIGGCSSPAGTTVVVINGSTPTVTLSGNVQSELGQAITGVKVKLTGTASDSLTTIAGGNWNFTVNQGSSYVVTPTKTNDIITYNGITTLDIVLMQRHILNTQLLPTPYKIIAADVNSSGSVTSLDIVLTKSLILQNTTSFPGGKLWNFVNSDFAFSVPTNPFPYEASRSYSSATAQSNQNFIGCKLGDVNNSWDPATAKEYSSASLSFINEIRSVQEGDMISIPVRVKDFSSISGFQYTINWDPSVLEFVGTTNAALQADFGTSRTSEGKLAVLWSTEQLQGITLSDGSVVFELRFRVSGNNGSSSPITIDGSMTSMEAVDKDVHIMEIMSSDGLITVGQSSSVASNSSLQYALLQNSPNPFATTTNISFVIPVDDQVKLSVYDMNGKLIWETEQSYAAGLHTVRFDAAGLADGTYYYKLQSQHYTAVRKMILIK
jgi:hypothetical protein